ncbi:MAG: archease, partial [candidate division WOR-3 bacterium]
IGIRISGKSITEIFWKAIHATADLLSGGIETELVLERGFSSKEENIKTALVSILEEVIYFFEKDLFLPSVCSVNIKEDFYEVHLKGNTVSAEDIKNGIEIKAVTYHQLEIKEMRDGFLATVIFDV